VKVGVSEGSIEVFCKKTSGFLKERPNCTFKKEIYKIAEIRNFEMKGTIKHKDNNLCD
jgi:hypothetical protein